MSDTDSDRLARIETMLIGITARDGDHETRIRKLERALYIGIGLAAAVGSTLGSLVGTALPLIGT